MPIKVLIMGLPGSGKTTLASKLVDLLQLDYSVLWLNADKVRTEFNDWDFSEEGRIRQSLRMRDLANKSTNDLVICDFVAPFPVMRTNFDPNILIWMDTILEGRFKDTNSIFVPPINYHLRILSHTEDFTSLICSMIKLLTSSKDFLPILE